MAVPALADDTASTVIAMERAALNGGSFVAISAPDVSYLDPALDKPIKGLATLTAYYATFPADDDPSPGEMSGAQMQVMNDIAVLSFHYVAHKGGKHEKFWNCTEVYRKTDAGWWIVNTHWSLTMPPQPLTEK